MAQGAPEPGDAPRNGVRRTHKRRARASNDIDGYQAFEGLDWPPCAPFHPKIGLRWTVRPPVNRSSKDWMSSRRGRGRRMRARKKKEEEVVG